MKPGLRALIHILADQIVAEEIAGRPDVTVATPTRRGQNAAEKEPHASSPLRPLQHRPAAPHLDR